MSNNTETVEVRTVVDRRPTFLMYVLAFFIPPLAVALHRGTIGSTLLNILLTLLGWLPGFIHALIVMRPKY